MRNALIALLFGLAPVVTLADEVQMTPSSATAAPAHLPTRGQSMDAVLKSFGEPSVRHAAVGGGAPQHPPITRWDYSGFSVFFEHSHVIDAVVPGNPPPIAHQDQLHAQ